MNNVELQSKLVSNNLTVSEAGKLYSECKNDSEVSTDTLILLLEYIRQHGVSELFKIDYLKYQIELLRRYYDTALYRRTNNLMITIESQISGEAPDWFKVLRAKMDIYNTLQRIVFYGDAQFFIDDVSNISDDKAREAVILEFLSLSTQCVYRYFDDGGKPNPANFKVAPSILDFVEQNGFVSSESFNGYAIAINKLAGQQIYEVHEVSETLEEEIEGLEDTPQEAFESDIAITASGETEEQIEELVRPPQPYYEDLSIELEQNQQILIIGDSSLKANVVYGIVKEFGINKDGIEVIGDYDKLTNFDVSKLQWSSKCKGIIIGPVPHKIKNIEGATSLVTKLKEEGFPYSVDARTESGELKITKSSLKSALKKLALHFYYASTNELVREVNSGLGLRTANA
jgi:hypothetical protein